jgi:hypothetical protein
LGKELEAIFQAKNHLSASAKIIENVSELVRNQVNDTKGRKGN